MSTSKLTGALCAAGALFLTGCETTSTPPSVTRIPGHAAVVQPDRDPRVPGVGYFVGFDANGSTLAPVDEALLDKAVLWLKAGSDRCVVVDAHVRTGADETERRLANMRMRTVISYTASLHIPQTRVRKGALREGLGEDTVLLREDQSCTDGQDGGGRAAAGFSNGRLASVDPGGPASSYSRDRSPTDPGASSQSGASPTVSTRTGTSETSAPSGGSSSGAGAGNPAGTGGAEPNSGGTGGSQGTGPTGQAPSGTPGTGTETGTETDQSPGTGPQGKDRTPGNNGVSSTTRAADRIDAGSGNGSEDGGDPGQSGGRNQGGDELEEQA